MKRDSVYRAKENTGPRMVAVIDIGASSLRMQIAEIGQATGEIRKLESFSQAVSVGKDSFTTGRIEKSTIEDCVRVLQIYRDKLNEYGIVDPDEIRVIATSGVREAANQLAFSDRVFVATGFEIERFDEAELHRVTYLGILPFLKAIPNTLPIQRSRSRPAADRRSCFSLTAWTCFILAPIGLDRCGFETRWKNTMLRSPDPGR